METSVKYRALFCAISALIAPCISYAMDPPPQVFRLSSTSPNDAFVNGLPAPGHDDELLRFASGASVDDRTSRYIATTASLGTILDIARVVLREHPLDSYWVYIIRPTENFHDMAASLLDAFRTSQDRNIRLQAINLWTSLRRDQVLTARDGISNTQIQAVSPVVLLNGHPVIADPILNAAYEPGIPAISLDPMPARVSTIDNVIVEQHGNPSDFINLTLSPDCSGHRELLFGTPQCLDATQIAYETLRSRSIAKLITDGTLLFSMDGKAEDIPGHDEL